MKTKEERTRNEVIDQARYKIEDLGSELICLSHLTSILSGARNNSEGIPTDAIIEDATYSVARYLERVFEDLEQVSWDLNEAKDKEDLQLGA